MKKFFSALLASLLIMTAALPAVSANAATKKWVTTWATSIVNGSVNVAALSLQDFIPAGSTIRIEFQVTTGGSKLQFQFSNKFGASDLTINAASVAKTDGEGSASIIDGTQVPITFDTFDSVTIPAGETVWSDEVDITTEALERLSVSLYFKHMQYITSTGLSNARTFLSTDVLSMITGGQTQAQKIKLSNPAEVNISSGTITYHTTPFLACVNTLSSEKNACTAVFIGDSTLVNNTYLHFAEKLIDAGCNNINVVNEAIIGNKLLSDGSGIIGNLCGTALIDRFANDALSLRGVKYIFVKIGLNDICHQFSKSLGPATPKHSPQDIIDGYKKLVEMAHSKGIKIYFFSKTPWKGYERKFLGQSGDLSWSMEIQKLCDELDKWVKSPNSSDGYIDCSVMKNPADPYALCPSFTIDGAHLTDAGSIAMADLIPLNFVGVTTGARTAAAINNIDVYAEQKQIQYNLDHPTTQPAQKDPAPVQTTAAPVTSPSPAERTTTANAEMPTAVGYEIPTVQNEPSTLPEYVTGELSNQGANTPGANYILENNVKEIGGSGSIFFVLILFLALVVAGIVVILTVNRKKDIEFE